MATGRKTVVVGQVIDPVAWGNPLWDQSVQEFASDADRTAQFPVAQRRPGVVTWIDDLKLWQGWDGAKWVRLSPGAVANAGVIAGAAYGGQPIKHVYLNTNLATDASGDGVLVFESDHYAGGGVLHCSVLGRSTFGIIFAVRAVGLNLYARAFSSAGAPAANQSIAITADITCFVGGT
jgi:hypothetical protein